MKITPIEHGRYRGRLSVTAAPTQPILDAILDGWEALADECPETHWPARAFASRECERSGRETSRRVFLTMIYHPRE